MGRKLPGARSQKMAAPLRGYRLTLIAGLTLGVGLTLGAGSAFGQAGAGAELPSATAAMPDAPGFAKAGALEVAGGGRTQEPEAPGATATGQVIGSVVDGDGVVLADADVTLTREGVTEIKRTRTDIAGRYHFGGVPAGRLRVTAGSEGMTTGTFSGRLSAGEAFEAPVLKLTVAPVRLDVDVTASQEELAEAELQVEEHQRLGGFVPNFFVSYDWHAAPLTTKQKFRLAWKNSIDPGNFVVSAGVAGVQQAQNAFPGYGQGAAGYGKRLGAASGDLLFGTMLGGAVFPTLFHQDPRYFYKGTGTVRSRLYYAVSRAVISRGDNGRWQPAYASILGDFSAGAVTNLYYPAGNRNGPGLTIEEGILNVGGDALGNVVQEFVLRHLTPHAPRYEGAPQTDTPADMPMKR